MRKYTQFIFISHPDVRTVITWTEEIISYVNTSEPQSLTYWLNNWLTEWLISSLIDCFTRSVTGWLTLSQRFLVEWLTDWLTPWMTTDFDIECFSINWLIWLTDCSVDCLFDWLIDWLTNLELFSWRLWFLRGKFVNCTYFV